MSSSPFDTAFVAVLEPVLQHLGFRQAPEPPGWIVPSKLYQRHHMWFGVESDTRDGYVAVTLGRLFRLRDVLARAIVRGPFRCGLNGQYEQRSLVRLFEEVVAELPDDIKTFDERWPTTSALEHERWSRSEEGETGYARYRSALGAELTVWPPAEGAVSTPDGAVKPAADAGAARLWQNSVCAPTYGCAHSIHAARPPAVAAQLSRDPLGGRGRR